MRIEDWSVTTSVVNPYAAPETQRRSLYGRVFGHPRFDDGKSVTTSSIVGKNSRGEVLTSSGSSYELGQVDPLYEDQFPGAKKELLGSL